VFITAVPITKLFAWRGGGNNGGHVQREMGRVCVYITAGPSTKLFTWGGGGYGRTCATRDDEPRPVWTSLPTILRCVRGVEVTDQVFFRVCYAVRDRMSKSCDEESDEHAADEAKLAAATSASEECRNPTLCAACVCEEAAACSGAKAQRQNCSNPVLGRFSPEPPSPDANKGFFGPIKDAVSAPGC
jgi:hypothetical protein